MMLRHRAILELKDVRAAPQSTHIQEEARISTMKNTIVFIKFCIQQEVIQFY